MLTETAPTATPMGIGTLSRSPTPELFMDLSDVPSLSPQKGATLFPVVRLLDERRCQDAGQTQH